MKAEQFSGNQGAADASGEPVELGRFNGQEIYPMPMFVTFAVPDVAAISDWYVRVLGFGVVFSGPAMQGQPVIVHLRRRKYQDVLIVRGSASSTNPSHASLTVSFHAEDLDALAAQARAAASLGSSAIEGPMETPWNTRDLRVTDPVGNRLVFTSRNENASPEQIERMRKMLDAGRMQQKT